MAPYHAVVIGATGAVGSAVVNELLASTDCECITTITRRPLDVADDVAGFEKLDQRVIGFGNLERDTTRLASACSIAFCTLGIGQPRKVSRQELWTVDVEYVSAFARGARTAGVQHISLLSAVGADADAKQWYLHVKGAAEEGVRAAGIARTSFFRPSLLVTSDIRYGFQDSLTQALFPRVSWMLPSRWHQIRVEDLARAMRVNAEKRYGVIGVEILHYAEFAALLG